MKRETGNAQRGTLRVRKTMEAEARHGCWYSDNDPCALVPCPVWMIVGIVRQATHRRYNNSCGPVMHQLVDWLIKHWWELPSSTQHLIIVEVELMYENRKGLWKIAWEYSPKQWQELRALWTGKPAGKDQ